MQTRARNAVRVRNTCCGAHRNSPAVSVAAPRKSLLAVSSSSMTMLSDVLGVAQGNAKHWFHAGEVVAAMTAGDTRAPPPHVTGSTRARSSQQR